MVFSGPILVSTTLYWSSHLEANHNLPFGIFAENVLCPQQSIFWTIQTICKIERKVHWSASSFLLPNFGCIFGGRNNRFDLPAGSHFADWPNKQNKIKTKVSKPPDDDLGIVSTQPVLQDDINNHSDVGTKSAIVTNTSREGINVSTIVTNTSRESIDVSTILAVITNTSREGIYSRPLLQKLQEKVSMS